MTTTVALSVVFITPIMRARAFIITITGLTTVRWPFIIKIIVNPGMGTAIINMTKDNMEKTITQPTRWIMG